jgi:ribosomal protein L17
MPRGLLEHKPTVPGPQEEVDKAKELKKILEEFVRLVKEGHMKTGRGETQRARNTKTENWN